METNTVPNLDLVQKLNGVSEEAKILAVKIVQDAERLKALNKLARQYVNLIKAAEALEEQKPSLPKTFA